MWSWWCSRLSAASAEHGLVREQIQTVMSLMAAAEQSIGTLCLFTADVQSPRHGLDCIEQLSAPWMETVLSYSFWCLK